MIYEEKFPQFIKMCNDVKENKIDVIAVATPDVLGDTYEEIIESLSRVAESGGTLIIAKRNKNT